MNFDLANSFYGKCFSSKTISARRSAEGYKSPQRDALRFIYCRRRCLFVAFSEREPFLRGFPVGSLESLWSKSCIWVSRKCAKSFVRFRPLAWIRHACQIWRLLQIGQWMQKNHQLNGFWTSWMSLVGAVSHPVWQMEARKKIVHFLWILHEKSVLTVLHFAGQIRGQMSPCRAWKALPNNVEHIVGAVLEPFRIPTGNQTWVP